MVHTNQTWIGDIVPMTTTPVEHAYPWWSILPPPPQYVPTLWPPLWMTAKPCEHCYCQPHKPIKGVAHKACCKCGERHEVERRGSTCR